MNTLNNHVQLVGNLGQDPELQTTKNGKEYLRLSLATSSSYIDQSGEWKTDTQWHRLIAWGKLAVKMQRILQKGAKIMVNGKLDYSRYTDKNGVEKQSTQIVISQFMEMNQAVKETA